MKNTILVVDDEKEIADLIEFYLMNDSFTVYKCYNAEEALQYIRTEKIDLAILDIMLPGISGFELCRMIRERDNYPIIMLTAKDAEVDKVTGLTIGADDYVTKPFRPLELLARIKAQLRRYKKYGSDGSGGDTADNGWLVCRDLRLNSLTHQCFVGEKQVSLTPTEFQVLKVLCERPGNVLSGEELFHAVWADEYYNKSNNTITVHIRHLREKLGDTLDKPKYIKTVWGVGYKIEA